MNLISLNPVRTDPVPGLYKIHTTVDVLRLDLVHSVISGNKWYKLKYYLEACIKLGRKYLLTFGGAYSNHIVATAAAAKECKLESIGIIRGERPAVLSHSLQSAIASGMQLFFISRAAYDLKDIPMIISDHFDSDDIYIVPEGGYGKIGMQGATDIWNEIPDGKYDHIFAATGTGTMLAGLINNAPEHISITGVSVLKNNYSIENEIRALLPTHKNNFSILFDYHFGGYAKKTPALLNFMNDWFLQTNIPSDFVYTGKLFFAVNELLQTNYFKPGESVLIIHSGGLQGNNSLPKGTLIF
jgi:1-aminocyclopropane-1-carboxylate deaminase